MNGLEIYNDILENTHNLKGTWEVTAENYLNVTGNTNGSIVLFDKTVGALGDFILEWTAEQKGGSYIHSNLCPSLRYTPEDAGIEGGGDNYAMLVYLCNYGGNPGTFNLRTENGTKSTVNTSGVSLNLDTVYTFKFERIKGKYKLYQDGVLINEASDVTDKKLYLGWYLWYGGTNSGYQTNFILREYNLTKINTYHYLDTIGLTTLWSKIKSLFATKTELGSKANDSDVVHKSGDETITGSKTFNGNLVAKQINTSDSSSILRIFGGINPSTGANLDLYGENESSLGGGFIIRARNSSGFKALTGKVDGSLSWDGKNVSLEGHTHNYLPLTGGALVGTGDLLTISANNSYMNIVGGTSSKDNPYLQLVGKEWDYEPNRGTFCLMARDGTNSSVFRGTPAGELTWDSKNVDTIDSQGTGWIRYSNGIQICYKMYINSNNVKTGVSQFTLPMPFIDTKYIISGSAYDSQDNTDYVYTVRFNHSDRTTSTFKVFFHINGVVTNANTGVMIIAIGKWK